MRIQELDGLRAIAILAVIDNHYFDWLPASGSRYGLLGVDLFFVLSGFLITGILLELRNKQHYFRSFYLRRALRIFPPFFLGVAVYLGVSIALRQPGTLAFWLKYVLYYTSLIMPASAAVHAQPPGPPFIVLLGLGVCWSLSIEEIYYTLWAPVVRFTTEKRFTAILAAMIVAAPILRWLLHTPQADEIYLFYCRMDALAYGSAVALLIRWRHIAPEKWECTDIHFDRLAIFVPLAAVVFWLVFGPAAHPIVLSVVGLVLADFSFALVIYAIVRHAGGDQFWVRPLRAKWLRSIGMVSYSLYLFHYPLLIVSENIVQHFALSRHADVICARALGLALSLAVAYGLWYGMESRILRWKERKVPSAAHPQARQPVSVAVG
ncbi:MAG TPA: acyltransferase [Terracidiphilus sp.]|nr:acyltransferase [Terracidiphilus sp.]